MTNPVISVTRLSKKYSLGQRDKKSDTIMGSVLSGLASPFRNLRNIRNLAQLGGGDDSIFWAIKDINFEVQQGEVLGIIGHNGAGKSTLLKILSQITEPSEGEVVIRGRVSSLLEVGTGFHPELTGRENVYMNGTILGMTKKEIDRKFEEIVEFSGVQKHLDTPVKFYSSGMKVRLGFAVAAHLEPDILIIDEVLAVGDAEFQKKCLGKMEDVAGQGRTVIFVSHNLNAIVNLCSRSILLGKGQLLIDSNSKNVVESYLTKRDNQELNDFHSDNFLLNAFTSTIDGTAKSEFLFDEDIILNFSFKNVEDRSRVGLAIFDDFERKVFIDFFKIPLAQTDAPIVVKATIPKSILTPGRYGISLSLMNPYEKVYWLRNSLSNFHVLKTASKYEKLTYDFGVVNINVKWEI